MLHAAAVVARDCLPRLHSKKMSRFLPSLEGLPSGQQVAKSIIRAAKSTLISTQGSTDDTAFSFGCREVAFFCRPFQREIE